jgi:hypothetical protein
MVVLDAIWSRMVKFAPELRFIMRAWSWVIVAAMGWGTMLAAYSTRPQPNVGARWAHGAIVIGPQLPQELANAHRTIVSRLRLVSAGERTESILKAMNQLAKEKAAKLESQLRPKLILLPLAEASIDATSLQTGHLPDAGRDQVIAGPAADHKDRLAVGDRVLDVVGVLKDEFALLRHDYLIPPSEQASSLFPDGEPSVHPATLMPLTIEQSHDRHFLGELVKQLSPPKYNVVMPQERLEPATFYTYLGGMATFLLGGSGALIGLFRWLAARSREPSLSIEDEPLGEEAQPVKTKAESTWWAKPLVEMERRPRLVWGVHLVYFGIVIAGSLMVYLMPDVQTLLLSNVNDALSAESGPLASAAKAYNSGSIPRAAVTTFVINFFLGSLLMLTLPSLIVPGSGTFLAILRSIAWGLLLAPTITALAHTMLPHSGTMLLEGEGYILATLFGLLIPIHIVQSSLGGTPLSRWGRVLWLNVLANFWVAVVLTVAACYEATEVILMNR